jgi:hypothetical protein
LGEGLTEATWEEVSKVEKSSRKALKFESVSYDAVASRKRSIEENSTPPPSPMDRLGKSFLYRSMTKRSVDECDILGHH